MSSRRGQGEGSIFQRSNGTWAAEVDLGRGPDGKRRRKTVYGRTRKEVAAKLQAVMADRRDGVTLDVTKLTVADYLERWLSDGAAHTVRPVTLESYRRYVNVHIIPAIGAVPLAKLQPLQLQNLYGERLRAGKSGRTVQYIHAILRRALNQAVKWQLLARNPALAVDAPRPARKEMAVLTLEQVERLVQSMTGDPLFALYFLAVATGCRRGELVALRWSDLDLQRRVMSINRTAEEVQQRVIWTEPKTNRSRRSITLPDEAVSILKAHRTHQLAERLKIGEYFQDLDLVFCRPDGTPISPGHISQHFGLLIEKAGLPRIRLHDLRHTHATMLLAAGVHPKVVSERLGHSTVTMTLDTYSHVLPNMQEEVAQKLNALLPSPTLKGTPKQAGCN